VRARYSIEVRILMKSKKGQAAFLVVILIAGAFALVAYFMNQSYDKAITFGQAQREMVETYSFAEQARAYISDSAKYASHQALYDLGASGGYTKSLCPAPIKKDACYILRGSELIDLFTCGEIASENSFCSSYNLDECMPDCIKPIEFTVTCSKTEYRTLACSVEDNFGDVEAFECFGEASDGCDRYGVSSPGTHKVKASLDCGIMSVDVPCGESKCGDLPSGVAIWSKGGKDCTPKLEELNSSVNGLFTMSFERLLDSFPMKDDRTLYDVVDYDMFINLETNRIIGKPLIFEYQVIGLENDKPFVQTMIEEATLDFENKEYGYTYSISPYFEEVLPINPTALYAKASSKAKQVLSSVRGCAPSCLKDEGESLSGTEGFNWSLSVEEGVGASYLIFDLKSTEVDIFAHTRGGKLARTGLPVRFAMQL